MLAREVTYAQSSRTVYSRALKEVQVAKNDIGALHGHLGGLGAHISGARLVAARMAGMEEEEAQAQQEPAAAELAAASS